MQHASAQDAERTDVRGVQLRQPTKSAAEDTAAQDAARERYLRAKAVFQAELGASRASSNT